MAEIIKEFHHWKSSARLESEGYPWDEWLDGQIYKLGPEDLRKMTFDDLARYIHKKAKQLGLEVQTKRWDYDKDTKTYQSLYVQALRPKERKNNA